MCHAHELVCPASSVVTSIKEENNSSKTKVVNSNVAFIIIGNLLSWVRNLNYQEKYQKLSKNFKNTKKNIFSIF
jgi:hypothetical protein